MKLACIKSFSPETQADFFHVTREYLLDWVYSKPPDEALLKHWSCLTNYQPENIRIAYRGSEPQAALHGELHSQGGTVHLLASSPGGGEEALVLLDQFERQARANGGSQLWGPYWASSLFYGGYVLGTEPCVPSWDTNGTCALVRAGYRMELRGVLMVCSLAAEIPQEPSPTGYDIVSVSRPPEFDACPFGYHAMQNGQKAAHCYARYYPHLLGPTGKPVGQVGNVSTEVDHRGRGLSRIMVKKCLRDLREMGAGEALIATSLDNFPALKSYENAGFGRRYNINCWVKNLTGS